MEIQQEHKKAWQSVRGDFYIKQKNSLNPVRRWFHRSRYKHINEMVKESYKEGMAIVDLGCGSCEWNTDKLHVIGIDYSKNMLNHGINHGNLIRYIVGDIKDKYFPNESVDIVVMSEVLEHINEPEIVLKRIYNMLKPNGTLIMSVPYDTFFSLWRPLFKIQCFIQWNILRKEVYKYAIGHLNHFSPDSIKKMLSYNNFKVSKIFSNKRFTIFVKAKKLRLN